MSAGKDDWIDIPESELFVNAAPARSDAARPLLRWKLVNAGGPFDVTFRVETKKETDHER